LLARGTSNINSITELRNVATHVKDFYSSQVLTDIQDNSVRPNEFLLFQNYPNPFNPSTVISYQLSVFSKVSLKVYDVLGKEIATLVTEEQQPGNYNYELGIRNYELSSGIYFYQLRAGSFIQTKKMIILK